MTKAKQILHSGSTWTDERARLTLPILLKMAKSGQTTTYGDLDQAIAREYRKTPNPIAAGYGRVLEIVGRSLNALSEEWGTELPPLTILVVNKSTGQPGTGVAYFLQRYISKSSAEKVTDNNRRAMIERATNAVFNYPNWDEVAAYFDIVLPGMDSETEPISLDKPPDRLGAESSAHKALKAYVAAHPGLFARIGTFGPGQIEHRLESGDLVDVFFSNDDQALAVEVKTADAPLGELTRGLFQCVKYRAVLRARYDIQGDLVNVSVVLVTPMELPEQHQKAAVRLQTPFQVVPEVEVVS